MERIFTDQMNRTVRLERTPRRIVSLVPSQTELLFDLGLDDEVVGITKFCIYPEKWFQSKQRVGGTKQLHLDVIKDLNPDLIIGNKEENTKEDIEALESVCPVWMSDIYTVEDALDMIRSLGELTEKGKESSALIENIRNEFAALASDKIKKSVLYFIWKDPQYVVGRNTFIDSMLTTIGFENYCSGERYPEWDSDQPNEPDLVFLSSEPFPFKQEHITEFQAKFPKSKIRIIDGEMFSWYGSRMQLAPAYFRQLFKELSDQ